MKTHRMIIYGCILAAIAVISYGGYRTYMYLADQYCWKCTAGQFYERASELIQAEDAAGRKKAIRFLKSAAVEGHVEALIFLAELYAEAYPETYYRHHADSIDILRADITPDPSMSASFFKQLSDILSPVADQYGDMQYNLGLLYETGQLSVADPSGVAKKWYEVSAAQGNVHAIYRLGLRYDAVGDYSAAAKLFKQAASSGRVPDAAIMMGDYYQYGKGLQQDYSQSMLMYRQALGILNEAGPGISPQTVKNLSDKATQRLTIVQRKIEQLPKGAAIRISYSIQGSVTQYRIYVPNAGGQLIGRVESHDGVVRAYLTGAAQAGSDQLIGDAASMNDGLLWLLNAYAKHKYGPDKRFDFDMVK